MIDEFEHPLEMSYQTGITLAINAISDAFMVVDGPNCVIFRTSQVQGNHDWRSTLLDCSGLHRVADTDCTTERAAAGDQRLLVQRLMHVDSLEQCELILLTAMSLVSVTGQQYDKIIRDLQPQMKRQVVMVPVDSLSGDWLHGYAWTLNALAEHLNFEQEPELDPNQVAIVGYFMDRSEADHLANLAEIERLLAGMNLELVSCWLNGGKVAELRKASQAATILSFPYGRQAANTLAARTGAKVIECELPVGLQGTVDWLETVGEGLARQEQARQVLERELSRVVPRLEWILPNSLFDKGLVIVGDPHLASSVARAVYEFGCRVELKVFWSSEAHVEERERQAPGALIVNPSNRQLIESIESLLKADLLDLLITNSHALTRHAQVGKRPAPFLELGFPSYHSHVLFERPYLGFNGALVLVERIANAISQEAVRRGG